ncbi:MAG TPA: serine hydrolase domain-containing protein, partial [Marmoricola sp.]
MSDVARFRAVLGEYQASRRLPTVVAAVLDDGEVSWTGTAGAGASSDAQFRIGSITKTMTAVLVMQARDEGLLALSDQLGRFVPESGYREATLRHLLSHTSGMQSEPAGPWWERSPGVDLATLNERNDGSGVVFAADTAYHYSNLGFALLGEVVARVRGAAWFEVLHAQLLEPLGMTRTTYLPQAPYAQGLSVDHLRSTLRKEPHQDTGAMAPAGQLWST